MTDETDPSRPGDGAQQVEVERPRSFAKELPFLIGLALVLTLGLRYFVVQAFYIPSNSMEQTLAVGDRVLVNKIPYDFRDPHRGEIVVFNGLDNFSSAEGVSIAKPTNPVSKVLHKISGAIGLGAPNETDYIKRVIAVAGDRVMCCDAQGRVVITTAKGKTSSLDESYIYQQDQSSIRYFCDAVVTNRRPPSAEACPPGAKGILVPKGRLWVMGDHRSSSADSRYHVNDANQGTVPVDKVIGKAVAVVYPIGHWRTLHVPATFHQLALPVLPLTPALGGVAGAVPVTLLRRRRLLRSA